MLLSAALSACPASDRTTKAAAATETRAALAVVRRPFDQRRRQRRQAVRAGTRSALEKTVVTGPTFLLLRN